MKIIYRELINFDVEIIPGATITLYEALKEDVTEENLIESLNRNDAYVDFHRGKIFDFNGIPLAKITAVGKVHGRGFTKGKSP